MSIDKPDGDGITTLIRLYPGEVGISEDIVTKAKEADAQLVDTIGSRIKRARNALRLTQNELADAAGVSRSAVALWEKELGSEPGAEKIPKLAAILECTQEWLLTGIEAKSPRPRPTLVEPTSKATDAHGLIRQIRRLLQDLEDTLDS